MLRLLFLVFVGHHALGTYLAEHYETAAQFVGVYGM